MIKTHTFITILIFCSSLYGIKAFGQVDKSQIPLSEIIEDLQQRFNYQFNYSEEKITKYNLIAPPQEFTFSECLDYLAEKTNLYFQSVGERIIYIKLKKADFRCGYLIDYNTQKPIANATVQSKIDNVLSDENGYFEINIDFFDHELRIQYLGYKPILEVNEESTIGDCLFIEMYPKIEVLSGVVINDYLVYGIHKLTDGSLKINFSKFSMLPGLIETDVLQSAQALPGIQSINETVSSINIRGGSNDQNLVLWDDIKMYQTGHFFGLISSFNSQITKEVSISKNGTNPSLTDGVSGTLLLYTDQNINDELKANIGVSFLSVDGFVDVPISKKSSLQATGRASLGYKLPTTIYKKYFDRISQNTEIQNNDGINLNSSEEFDFTDVSIRWLYQPNANTSIRANFISFQDNLEFYETGLLDGLNTTRESNLLQNSSAGGLFYKQEWSEKFSSQANVYFNLYELEALNANVQSNLRFRENNQVKEASAKLITFYQISNKISLQNGYQYSSTSISDIDEQANVLLSTSTSESINNHGLFSNILFSSEDNRTNLNAGLRLNYIPDFSKGFLEPRINLNHRFSEDFTLQVLGEYKHQNTSQIINFKNDFFGIENRRWQLANDKNIPIIRSKQLSLGVSYTKLGWLVDIEGYYKSVDGITSQSQGFSNKYQSATEIGSYEIVGFDFLIRKKYLNFSNWISYSALKNDYTFKAFNEITFPSNFDIRHSISLGSTYSKGRLKISGGLDWRTGKPTSIPVFGMEVIDGNINFGSANTERLPNYYRVNLSTNYKFSITEKFKGEFGFSVSNIFNRKNVLDDFYSVTEDNEVTRSILNSLGFTTNALIRIYY